MEAGAREKLLKFRSSLSPSPIMLAACAQGSPARIRFGYLLCSTSTSLGLEALKHQARLLSGPRPNFCLRQSSRSRLGLSHARVLPWERRERRNLCCLPGSVAPLRPAASDFRAAVSVRYHHAASDKRQPTHGSTTATVRLYHGYKRQFQKGKEVL